MVQDGPRTSYITYTAFVGFELAAFVFLIPMLIKRWDLSSILRTNQEVQLFIPVIILVLATSLFFFVHHLLFGSLSLHERWRERLKIAVPILLTVVFALIGCYRTDRFRDVYGTGERYVFMDAGALSSDLKELLSARPEFKVISCEQEHDLFENVTSKRNIYSGNIFRFKGIPYLEDSVLKMDASVQRLMLRENDMFWHSVSSESLESSSAEAYLDSITLFIVSKLAPSATQSDIRSTMNSLYKTDSMSALSYYLLAKESYDSGTEKDLVASIELYKKALQADSDFIIALAGISDSYCQLYHRLWRRSPDVLDSAALHLSMINLREHDVGPVLKSFGLYWQTRHEYYQHRNNSAQDSLSREEFRDSSDLAYDSAFSFYTQAEAKMPNNYDVLNNIGALTLMRCSSKYGKNRTLEQKIETCDSAIHVFEQQLRQNPFEMKTYTNLGSAYIVRAMLQSDSWPQVITDPAMKDLRKSFSYLTEALAFAAGDQQLSPAYFNLACAYSLAGKFVESKQYLNLALSDPVANWYYKICGDQDNHILPDEDLRPIIKHLDLNGLNEIFREHKLREIDSHPFLIMAV